MTAIILSKKLPVVRVLCRGLSELPILSYVSIRARIKETKPLFKEKTLQEALTQPVKFKLTSYNPDLVTKKPENFEFGKSEYDFLVDSLILAHSPISVSSLNSVIGRDSVFLQLLKSVIDCKITLDQSLRSSYSKCQDFTVDVRGSLALVGEENVDNEQQAIKQILMYINTDMFGCVLPKGHSCIPALATTNDKIVLHSIQYNEDKSALTSTELRSYSFNHLEERLLFLQDFFRLACWMSALPQPTMKGMLLPGVPTDTSNGHNVKLTVDGIIKTFGPNTMSPKTLGVIRRIYAADLQNVERGEVMSVSPRKLLITSVGQPLADAIESGLITDRTAIIADVRSALDQLHAMGIAHCDVALCNAFLMTDGKVLLGDLEYCRPAASVAPTGLYRSLPASTAQEMDELQFKKFFVAEVDKKFR